jgi:riboflavin kinase/FMN adenylyltransferase
MDYLYFFQKAVKRKSQARQISATMKIIEHIEALREPFPNAVITIGNFDGVHIGHQGLFHEVVQRAEALAGTAIAMTFEPHPLRVLQARRKPPLITLYEQKKELIGRTGVDVLICIPFDHAFAAISAREFVADLLVRRIGMRAIVVGQDYAFGRHREGNIHMLRALGRELGFEVHVTDWIQAASLDGERISSTRIRELVMAGQVVEASRMLGRRYQVRGQVVAGRNRGGKLLGFPTANIALQDELCPKTGIYAVTVEHAGRRLLGVANIGYSPTFEDHVFTVEVHLLDFHESIYGETIRVNFIQRIRDEARFESLEDLSRQIQRDVETARRILAAD